MIYIKNIITSCSRISYRNPHRQILNQLASEIKRQNPDKGLACTSTVNICTQNYFFV